MVYSSGSPHPGVRSVRTETNPTSMSFPASYSLMVAGPIIHFGKQLLYIIGKTVQT